MVTIPRDIRRREPWLHAAYVNISYRPPALIIVPLTAEQMMRLARAAGEPIDEREIPHR